jgi:hypothetical protein
MTRNFFRVCHTDRNIEGTKAKTLLQYMVYLIQMEIQCCDRHFRKLETKMLRFHSYWNEAY